MTTFYNEAKDALLMALGHRAATGNLSHSHRNVIRDLVAKIEASAPKPGGLPERACWFCHRSIVECMGFTLARDIQKILDRPSQTFKDGPRELCQVCADKLGEFLAPMTELRAGNLGEAAREAMKAYLLNDTLSTEARFRRAVEAAAPYICAGKDSDTAAVIRDNDKKMAEIETLKRRAEYLEGETRVNYDAAQRYKTDNDANIWEIGKLKAACEFHERLNEGLETEIEQLKAERLALRASVARSALGNQRNESLSEEIERLKRSLELYRKDIHVMRERLDTSAEVRSAMREEISRLAFFKDGYEALAKVNAALRHHDIDAAAGRARAAYFGAERVGNYIDNWLDVARAVYGTESHNK